MTTKCTIDECGNTIRASGMCVKHYQRKRRHGDPRIVLPHHRQGKKSVWLSNGYRMLWLNGRIVPEHRHIMSLHIGRELFPHENVHHINGVRDDNRLENLELWSTSQPSGQRVTDKTLWALDWLKTYLPEALDKDLRGY